MDFLLTGIRVLLFVTAIIVALHPYVRIPFWNRLVLYVIMITLLGMILIDVIKVAHFN